MTFADTQHLPHRHPSERWEPASFVHTAKTLDPSVRWGDVRKSQTSLTKPHHPESHA
jgi:hypothetical protein